MASHMTSKNPDKYEEDYDPDKDTRPYTVYRNDIKYRDHNDIDISRAEFDDDDVRRDFLNGDTDTIEYRIIECFREKFQVMDLSHMDPDVFDKLITHDAFDKIASKIEVVSANDCGIETLPDLSSFTNLISLNIGDNNLRNLPKLPDSLEELIIDNNQIQTIPYLRRLKRLRARNNDIRRIHYTETMESLILTGNRGLSELAELPRLYHLEIGKTRVSDIPMCTNLKYLDLEETDVEVLPDLPHLYILTCVRSKLFDISNLRNLYCLVATDSKVRRIHYMETLQKFTYNSKHQNEIRLSKRYRARRIFKNKNNVIDVLFKENPIPVNVMS